MHDSDSDGRAAAGAEPERSGSADVRGVLQVVVSASADGIVAVDEQGIIRIANTAAEELFARSTRELVGSAFGFPLVANEPSEIELLRSDGGRCLVELRVTATIWDEQRLYGAALRDVTHRRSMQGELEAELDHQKTVVAVAAHELHNPLAAIKLFVDLLRNRGAELTEGQRIEFLDRIAERTDAAQTLTRKLLTASTIEVRDTRSTQPHLVLELLLERLGELGEQGWDLRLSCGPELVAVADRDEFSEMVANYVDNARTYGRSPIEVQATKQAGWVEVRVCDNGPGVPEEFVPHLFERFSRDPHVEKRAGGAGLGLWIVRRLAQANGGDAWYEPNVSGGACFCLRLPGTPSS